MDDNNLVKEIYPEQVKSINPYDISYIAMKNGSIIMIIEKEQTSPNFNIQGKKYMSYINQEKKEKEEYNNINYSFRSDIKNEENNPYFIEKKQYIFYKKSNNKEKEEITNNKNLIKHSKTFSYTNTTPIKEKNKLKTKNNTYIKNKYNNNDYNNISVKYSRYSSNNKIQDSNYGFIKSNSEIIDLNKNEKDIIYSDDYYDIIKKPKIEYSDDYAMNKYSIKRFDNHNVLSNSVLTDKNYRAKTPIYTMRDLGKKNHRKNKGNNLELKKCLSKDNHRYYERKELSAPKKSKSNYIRMTSLEGNTIHVFENK